MLKHATAIAWGFFVFAIIALAWAPAGVRFPGVLLSTFAFAAVLTWIPRSRPVTETLLCPWNWALFLFFLQLTVMPILITLDGPALTFLPFLPSAFAINVAMIVYSLGFVVIAITYSHCLQFGDIDDNWLYRLRNAPEAERNGSGGRAGMFLLLGIAGVILSFGGLAGLLDYYSNPVIFHDVYLDSSSTWRGVGAMFLKPFLGFAVVMMWCRWLDSGARTASALRRCLIATFVVAGVVFSFSVFNFNRGLLAVPLLAVATLPQIKGDRPSWRIMALVGLLFLLLTPLYVLYRSGTEPGTDLLSSSSRQASAQDQIKVSDFAQMYGGAPQYLAFLLEQSHWGINPRWGVVTISSIVAPVPVLGKPFRPNSGFSIFNRMLYGTDAILDQNVPFHGEPFLDFHLVGIIAGAALFGWVLYRLQRAFQRSRSSIEIYIWQYLSVWTCFLIFGFGSIGVQSQLMIYYCWPIYFVWFLNRDSRVRALLPLVRQTA